MANTEYVCLRCQKKFSVDVITAEEASRQNVNLAPVRCPDCKREDVRPASEIEV